jgi:CheY-like chemotaxis protein
MGGGTMRVLLVEDDRIMKHGLKELLVEEGHEVKEASDGIEALDLIKGEEFDVVLTDLKMPRLDGIGVLKKVKSINNQTHVVIMTAFATVETAIEALKLGAYDYLKKPIDIKEVVTLLEAISEERMYQKVIDLHYMGRNDACLDVYKELVAPRDGLIITPTPQSLEGLGLRGEVIAVKSAHEIRGVIESHVGSRMGMVIFIHNIESLFSSSLDLREYFQNLFDLIMSRKSFMIIGIESRKFVEELWDEFINQSADYYVELFSETLRNRMRRDIIKIIFNNGKQKFSAIQRAIGERDSPKLSFHLKKLVSEGVLMKTSGGDYSITDKGITLARTIEFLATEAEAALLSGGEPLDRTLQFPLDTRELSHRDHS